MITIKVDTLKNGTKEVKLEEKNRNITYENWKTRTEVLLSKKVKHTPMTEEQKEAWSKRCAEIDGY